jgi:hypothetical protein
MADRSSVREAPEAQEKSGEGGGSKSFSGSSISGGGSSAPAAGGRWASPPITEEVLRRLAKAYAGAVAEAGETGRVVEFRVRVEPGAGRRKPEMQISQPGAGVAEPGGRDGAESSIDAARRRGHVRAAAILAGGDMLSADELARDLGCTRATLNAWRQKRRALALEGPTRGFRYPAWQIGRDGRPYPELPRLFALLGDSPWAVYRFLVQRHPELGGRSALEALKRGEGAAVVAAAGSVAEAFS